MEVDHGSHSFGIPEAAGALFDSHDSAVDALGQRIGPTMLHRVEYPPQMLLDHPRNLPDRLKP